MKKILRKKTRPIAIAGVTIGGNHPIAIQSMTKTKTSLVEKTLQQIKALEKAGCEIVRVAVKDIHDARAIKKIKLSTKLPIVADIHFDYRLALAAIENGVDKVRLNPGNIFRREEIKDVAFAARAAGIPIRVGVNSGSLKQATSLSLPVRQAGGRQASHRSQADRMVQSALSYIRTLEKFKFHNIVVSLKASNISDTVESYRKISCLCEYPLHLGVTATGVPFAGAIKSAIAVGALLLNGIGDTIRISLTDTPEQEIAAGKIILESLGLRFFYPEIISCPTCGRCEVDLIRIVKELEGKLQASCLPAGQAGLPAGRAGYRPQDKPFKVAIMGCVVNGPGEAKEADVGIAFGKREGLLFKQGRPVKRIALAKCIATLLQEMEIGHV